MSLIIICPLPFRRQKDRKTMANQWQNIHQLIEYPQSGILSKELIKSKKGNITLFSMVKGASISEHKALNEGHIYVIEGSGIFNLEGQKIRMEPGVFISMKPEAIHSLQAEANTTFILFLINH